MNDQTEIDTSTALAIPEKTSLEVMFRADGGVDPLIAQIAAKVRAHAPDVTTKKGRDAIKSLAYAVARSKTALDDAGKLMNEEARAQISVVDAARKKIRDQLDALRDEARKPLDEWEAAEEARVAAIRGRLERLTNAAPDEDTSDKIKALIARVEITMIDDTWQEYLPMAAKAKDATLARLRAQLAATETREAEAAELAHLRAEAAAREEADRLRREAEDADARRVEAERAEAERLRAEATSMRGHIEQAGNGMIGGDIQPFGILIYELDRKVPALIDALGDYAEELHILRKATLRNLNERMDRQKADEAAKAEQDRAEAADRAAKTAAETAKREKAEAEERHARDLAMARADAEAAAQAERDRLAAEAKAEADARAKREADQSHRAEIAGDIANALRTMSGNATPENIAAALIDGKIPHCKVEM